MANVPPQFYEAYNFIAGIFAIDPTWLIYPNIILVFLMPLVFNIIAMYFILERLVRVFPGTGINYLLGGVIGFLMLPYNEITIWVTPFIIGFFAPRSPAMKLVLIIILFAIIFGLRYVIELSLTGFNF